MTGNAAVADAVAVLKEGAFDYLTKPINLEELGVQLQRLAAFRSLQPRRRGDPHRADASRPSSREQLVGHSPGMLELVKRMETIAHSDAAVVITGESGTGKELVARALHEGSGRRSKPFVAVNCAAFPDTLIEASCSGTSGARSPAPHSPRGPVQGGARRHAVPRRGRGAVAGGAGQAAPRAAGRDDRAAGQQRDGEGRRAHHLGDPPRPARAHRRRAVPRGSLLSNQHARSSRFRRCDPAAGISRCWCSTSSSASPTPSARPTASPGGPGTRCRRIRFRATSGS